MTSLAIHNPIREESLTPLLDAPGLVPPNEIAFREKRFITKEAGYDLAERLGLAAKIFHSLMIGLKSFGNRAEILTLPTPKIISDVRDALFIAYEQNNSACLDAFRERALQKTNHFLTRNCFGPYSIYVFLTCGDQNLHTSYKTHLADYVGHQPIEASDHQSKANSCAKRICDLITSLLLIGSPELMSLARSLPPEALKQIQGIATSLPDKDNLRAAISGLRLG